MTSLATHVSVFLRERLPLERGASERTCDTYALALRLFFEFAARQLKVRPSALTLEQLDAPMVLAFLAHLETQRHNSPATRNVRLAAIRTFIRFIEYREPSALAQVQRIRAIPMKRADTRLVDYLIVRKCKPYSMRRHQTHVTAFAIVPCCMWPIRRAYASPSWSVCAWRISPLTPDSVFTCWEKDAAGVPCLSGERPRPRYEHGLRCDLRGKHRKSFSTHAVQR